MAGQARDPKGADGQGASLEDRVLNRRSLVTGAATAAAGLALATGRVGAKAPAVVRQDAITIPLFTTENDPNTLAFYERTIAGFSGRAPQRQRGDHALSG